MFMKEIPMMASYEVHISMATWGEKWVCPLPATIYLFVTLLVDLWYRQVCGKAQERSCDCHVES